MKFDYTENSEAFKYYAAHAAAQVERRGNWLAKFCRDNHLPKATYRKLKASINSFD